MCVLLDKNMRMKNVDSLVLTRQIVNLMTEIDEFKGAWTALGNIAPDRLLQMQKVATIESIASSTRIEGSLLTDQQVEKLIANLSIQKFETRDEQEVAGYADLMTLVFCNFNDIPLTESMHGAGSPQAQRIQIARQMQLDFKKDLAKALAGIDKPKKKILLHDITDYFGRVFDLKV